MEAMRSQTVTASKKRNVRFRPYAFTEHGALMAANVLNSPQAIKMSVALSRHLSACDRHLQPPRYLPAVWLRSSALWFNMTAPSKNFSAPSNHSCFRRPILPARRLDFEVADCDLKFPSMTAAVYDHRKNVKRRLFAGGVRAGRGFILRPQVYVPVDEFLDLRVRLLVHPR